MTALIQLSALLLLGSAMFNAQIIGHWLITHKRMGLGIYIVLSWAMVAAMVWLLGSLVDML